MPSPTLNRRERGYAFEKRIVDFFNGQPHWQARRLGGSSTGLPDVAITNNEASVLYTVEAKSNKVGNEAYIDNDQIVRCLDVLDFLGAYKKKQVIFAFKFMRNEDGVKYSTSRTTGKKKQREPSGRGRCNTGFLSASKTPSCGR